MQNIQNAMSVMLNSTANIFNNINRYKIMFLEQNKMAEYDLCNDHRVRFYQFRHQFLKQITHLITYRDFDFSFISKEVTDIEAKLDVLGIDKNSEHFQLIADFKIEFQNIREAADLINARAKILTADQLEKIREQALEFEYEQIR